MSTELEIFGILSVIVMIVCPNRFGINLKALSCPRCIRPISRGRGPVWLWRFFFGGASCQVCNSVVDKFGVERLPGEGARKRALRNRQRDGAEQSDET